MAYNSISIKPYIKSHLELQREITLIELALSPYFFVLSICLAYLNLFARFDENPGMNLQDIKETKRYGRTHGRTDGQTDNVKTVYPLQTKFAGGIMMMLFRSVFTVMVLNSAGCHNRIFRRIPALAVSILAFRDLLFTVVMH